MEPADAWTRIAAAIVERLPPHREVCVPKWSVPGVRGLRKSLGLGRGRHYSLPLPEGGRLHVVDRGGWCYRVHWDLRDPHRDPLGHLVLDSPVFTALAAGALELLSAGAAAGLIHAAATIAFLHAAARLGLL